VFQLFHHHVIPWFMEVRLSKRIIVIDRLNQIWRLNSIVHISRWIINPTQKRHYKRSLISVLLLCHFVTTLGYFWFCISNWVNQNMNSYSLSVYITSTADLITSKNNCPALNLQYKYYNGGTLYTWKKTLQRPLQFIYQMFWLNSRQAF